MRSIFIVFSLFTLACSAGDDVNTTQPDINSTPETSVPTDSDDAPVSDTQTRGEERDVDGDRPQRSDADATSPAGGEDDDDAVDGGVSETQDTDDPATDGGSQEPPADAEGGTPEDSDTIDEGAEAPAAPTERQANATWQVTSAQLVEGQYTYAWDPDGNALLLQDMTGATLLANGGFIPETVSGDPGALTGAANIRVDGAAVSLVAGDQGLHVLQEGTLMASPLDALLEETLVTELLGQPGLSGGEDDWLWMAGVDRLWLFRSGELFSLTEDSLTLGSERLVYGPLIGEMPGLWGSSQDGIWGLHVAEQAMTLAATRLDLRAADMTADAAGHLWVVDELGDLHQRQPDGTWIWWRLPSPVERVIGAQATAGLWLVVGDEIWFWQDHQLGPLETALTGALLNVDTKGRAMLANGQGVYGVAIDGVGEVVVAEPPTWEEDIKLLNETHCSQCHGEGAFAHPMFEMQTWIDEYDLIISMVAEPPGNPQMPLPPNPPLDNASISAIIQWQEAGFPE